MHSTIDGKQKVYIAIVNVYVCVCISIELRLCVLYQQPHL